jgi:serine/threonine protein kinase/tetratricopeptide (TPR) repeat protein
MRLMNRRANPLNELDLFAAAIAIADPAKREALLDRECAGRAELRQRLDLLLEAHGRTNQVLDLPNAAVPNATGAYAPAPSHVGTIIAGRYKLLEEIGDGGMGVVWMAEQREPVKRVVAVKLIKDGMDSRAVLARFEAERQALALMDHPNIAKVLDGGTTADGRPFFVMELVKGLPLTDYCDARRLPVKDRLDLFVQICSAVQHAHQKAVIHRDLKPSNVLVTEHDGKPVPKVIDFGLAKALNTSNMLTERTLHTAYGTVVGTPLYMAPEQVGINALDVDTRTNIYALGVMLYELLTGSTPLEKARFKEAAWEEVKRLIREEEPPRPSTRLSSDHTLPSLAANRQVEPAQLRRLLRGDLDWIVMKALDKDRSRRYETATGLAKDVQRHLAGDAVEACPPTLGYKLKKLLRRNRPQVIAASLLLIALLAGITGTTWGLIRAEKAKADLAAKNAELIDEQSKVQARFDLAVKAIETFHTGVSEDMLLKNAEFKELRAKLLKEAAGFYAELEKLLAGQTDAKSRKALADGYYQLGKLTGALGDYKEELVVLRKALALQRELAAAPDADVETRMGVANSLRVEAMVLFYMRDLTGTLRTCEELRQLATALEEESASDVVRAVVARSHYAIGALLFRIGKHEAALPPFQKAIFVAQKVADTNPDVAEYQSDLARFRMEIGLLLMHTGKPDEALTAMRKALVIWQQLADANRAVSRFRFGLANAHDYIAWCLLNLGRPVDAEEAERKGLDIIQKLVDDYPADNLFQNKLANSQMNLGRVLDRQKRLAEALPALEKGVAVLQNLAKSHPDTDVHTREFGESHAFRGGARARAGQPAEAAADLRRALELWTKLPSLDIEIQVERSRALALLAGLGRDEKSGVTMDEARAFADQSVAALADAIAAGWSLPSELNEPDFDALRSRADFQKQVAKVKARGERK